MTKCNLRRHTDHRFCCAACHRAFSSMVPFDWHRRGFICTDPALAVDKTGRPRFRTRANPGIVGYVAVWGCVGTWSGPNNPSPSAQDGPE